MTASQLCMIIHTLIYHYYIGAGLHSTRTSDGLPTLKVQSINQKLLEGRGSTQRRRSKTLPPLKISTRYVLQRESSQTDSDHKY